MVLSCSKETCKSHDYVCMRYVDYVKCNFLLDKTHVTLVFDDYDDPDSTKKWAAPKLPEYYTTVSRITDSTPFVTIKSGFWLHSRQKQFVGYFTSKKWRGRETISWICRYSYSYCSDSSGKVSEVNVNHCFNSRHRCSSNPNCSCETWKSCPSLEIQNGKCSEKSVLHYCIKKVNIMEWNLTFSGHMHLVGVTPPMPYIMTKVT